MNRKYHVAHIASVPGEPFTPEFGPLTLQEAVIVQDALADYDLHLAERGYRDEDFSNSSWIEYMDPETEEWEEIDQADIAETLAEQTAERNRILGEAMGQISVCWENPAGAGVFDSSRAARILNETIDALFPKILPATEEGTD